MKRKFRGIVILVLTSLLLAGVLGACGTKNGDKDQSTSKPNTNQDANTDTKSDEKEDDKKDDNIKEDDKKEELSLSGTLTMAGSTSMEKLAHVAGEAFMEKYPKVMVSAEFIGSSAGVEAVLAGTVNIGNASRNLKDSEKSSGAIENIVAIDGIAVITDKNNTVNNITKDQLIQIYTGEINNWSELGGENLPIVVVGRESGSGTRGAFEELLKIEDLCKYANEINSTGGVMAKVASTAGAIGYVSLDVLDKTVAAINIDEVEPTEANIKAGNYSLSRPFVMATVGEVSEQNELVQAFFEFIQSDEGKELIKAVGLITVE